MANQNNVQLAKKIIDLFNKNDVNQMSGFDEIFSQDVKFHDPNLPKKVANREELKNAEREYIKAFPNKKTTVDATFSSDDHVVIHWSMTAMQKQPFQGIAPQNKELKICGISLYKISNNKVVEAWQEWDRAGLMEQLGELKHAVAHSH